MLDRTLPPGRVVTFGRAAMDPNRLDPLGGRHEMSDDTAKVEKTGVYTLPDGTPVRLKEGDVLPLGAEFRDEGEDIPQSQRARERAAIAEAEDQRAKAAAPENRAKGRAPEDRSKG